MFLFAFNLYKQIYLYIKHNFTNYSRFSWWLPSLVSSWWLVVAGVWCPRGGCPPWYLPGNLARIFTAGHAGGGKQGSSVRRRSRL